MSGPQPFNLEFVIRANVAQGKAGLTDIDAALRGVTAGAADAGRATGAQAAALDKMAQAAARAALTQKDLAAAELQAIAARRKAALGPANVLAQQQGAVFAARRGLEASTAGLHARAAELDDHAGYFERAVVKSREYQQTLDNVRAAMNPLFAASRQYEQQLLRISDAEEMGAINALEAAAARERAASIIAPLSGNVGRVGGGTISSAYTSNVAAQGFDIAVTAGMGMNPLMIGLQQGTHVAQVMQQMGGGKQALQGIAGGLMSILSPTTLLTVGLTSLAAVGIQGLMSLKGETKSLDEALGDLVSRTDSIKKSNEAARRSITDLAREFGSAAGEAKGLLQALAEIERRGAGRDVRSAMGGIVSDVPGGSWLDLRDDAGRFGSLRDMFAGKNRNYAEGSRLALPVHDAVKAVREAQKTDDIETQTKAVEHLFAVATAAASAVDGFSKEGDEWLRGVGETLKAMQTLRAEDANAPGKEHAKSITRDYQQRVELERAALQYGQQSAEVREIEARHEREALVARLENLDLTHKDVEMRNTLTALSQLQAAREAEALEERRKWLQSKQDEVEAIRLEVSLIGMSNAEAERARAIAEAELEIRDEKLGLLDATLARVQAIAAAEARAQLERGRAVQQLRVDTALDGFDMQIRRAQDPAARATLEAQKEYVRLIGTGMNADLAAAHAARVRANALDEVAVSAEGWLRGQAERIAALKLEIALVGQSADVRARVLALAQAERDIAAQGLTGEAADAARRSAEIEAGLVRTLEAQADAWRRVQSAGEGAIDGILDKLRDGSVKGALREMANEVGGMFFDLQIRNPIKNLILGTDLGTMEDVGGFGGIWGRLTGRNRIDEQAAVAMGAAPVQSMTVSAAQVILQAGALNLTGLSGLAANLPGSPGSLTGSGDVQAQVWAFFAQKGLKPHQIAGIMGNISAESGFDPLAKGDFGQAFGLFQHNDRKHRLFDFIGGQQNLGDVQKQLEFAWHELMTSENGPYRRLMASTDVRGATEAFLGFERPQGYQYGARHSMHYDQRVAAAEAAMGRFEAATVTAQQQLGQLGTGAAQLGTGLQSFGSSVAGVIQSAGAQRGLGGMLAGGLLTGLGQAIGIPGFDRGGWTGPGAASDVAGLVHAEEYVFDAPAVRRIGVGNLESIRRGAMRGYQSGGYVTAGRGPALPAGGPAAPAAGGGERRVTFEINVTGTGNAEVQQAVHTAIEQAFDLFGREALPGQVRSIVNDRWGG